MLPHGSTMWYDNTTFGRVWGYAIPTPLLVEAHISMVLRWLFFFFLLVSVSSKHQWLGSVQTNVLKYMLFGCVTTCPSGRRLKLSPSDYRKLVKVFRNDSETTKAQACHGMETAGILQLPTWTSQMAFMVLWSNETKIILFCHNEKRYVWGEVRFLTEQQSTNCQYNVGSVILCRCLAASGSGT